MRYLVPLAYFWTLAIAACAAPTTMAPPPTSPPLSPKPQPLLRRACGRNYVVRTDEAIKLFYGGWGVKGFDLAQQWTSALTVDLTIDGQPVEGQQQPISSALPLNRRSDADGVYWLFYKAIVPGLAPGRRDVTITFYAQQALLDGFGIYGPGRIAVQTFRIMAE